MGQGRLINTYYSNEQGMDLWRRVAGTQSFLRQDNGYIRGMLWLDHSNQILFVAGHKVGLYAGSNTPIIWLAGEIDGEEPVCISKNNNPVTDIVITTGTRTYVVKSSAVEEYPDGEVGIPNSVCFLDGYLFFGYNDGTIKATDLNTTTIPALSYVKAEASPDGIVRVLTSRRYLYAFGSNTIEIYQNAANPDFPFVRSYVLETGLWGRWAVDGGAIDGWDNPIFFVASDGSVRSLQDYQTSIISTDAVTRDILSVKTKDDIRCFVYVSDANPLFVVTSKNFTWEYNLKTKQWHERRSYYEKVGKDWRYEWSVYAFNQWLVADKYTGEICTISNKNKTEVDKPLVMVIESVPMTAFPRKIACRRVDFDFVVGYGREQGLDPIEIDPTVIISWSSDSGVSFSTPIHRQLGREGHYNTLVSVLNTGIHNPQGVVFRISVSDPIDCSLKSAHMGADARII